MADQLFPVTSGFYDSVDNDRLYSADDMNRPYRRLVGNGVFATPQGTPSTDLQVTATSGMVIKVAEGEGLFGDRWFENPSDISITVPANTEVLPRIDSVIVQVDSRQSGRVANIVYRTGNPATNPVAPSLSMATSVSEYRVANIRVAAGASALSQSAITDCRGSAECPWVTSLVTQPDTSSLWDAWNTAYTEFYDNATAEYNEYTATQRESWEEFIAGLTEDLTVATNIIPLTGTYTSTASVSTIPIPIASYNANTDVLLVFINGLNAQGKYTANGSNIVLTNAISAGQTVNFLVLKSVTTGDLQSVTALIQSLDAKLTAATADSGWKTLVLNTGFRDQNLAYRKIGSVVYWRGTVTITGSSTTAFTIPAGYRPAATTYVPSVTLSGTPTRITINTSGNVVLQSGITNQQIPFCFSYPVG